MIAFPSIEVRQRVQPLLGKESIGPAVMVAPTPTSWLPLALTQDTPQPHPHPGVQRSEGTFVTLFEIFKPAPQCAIDVFDDNLQAMTVGASRLGTNRVFELPETLLPRPTIRPTFCPTAEEGSAALSQ